MEVFNSPLILCQSGRRLKRKRPHEGEGEEGPPLGPEGRGGGRGIHRKNPERQEFDYGSEYKAKVGLAEYSKASLPLSSPHREPGVM